MILAVVIFVIIAAAAFITAFFVTPVYRVYSNTMSPALEEGSYAVGLKTKKGRRGDLVAFDHNNKILIKRVIAIAGEHVNIDRHGQVYINGEKIEEAYVSELDKGKYCDVEFPCVVPAGCVFVLGDSRADSVDSRSSAIGFVPLEQITAKILFSFKQ